MSETKSCGNCRYFKDEDADGKGYCENYHGIFRCDEVCVDHDVIDNGWTEITPDNVDGLYPFIDRVMVAYKLGECLAGYSSLTELYKPLKDLALTGGYYFFILPELKIE